MVDGRLLGFVVAAGAVIAIGVARSQLHRVASRGKLEPEQIQVIRRRLLALLFACGLAVAVAMTAAVVAASRAGDDTVSALAWGGLLAGVIVAAGALLNAASLWRSGRW
jgi:fructose-specific phosphotransferase system IIC component